MTANNVGRMLRAFSTASVLQRIILQISLRRLHKQGALADLDRAAALNPAEPAILLNRGQVRINAGDKAGGCDDLRKALERGRADAGPLVAKFCS